MLTRGVEVRKIIGAVLRRVGSGCGVVPAEPAVPVPTAVQPWNVKYDIKPKDSQIWVLFLHI